MSYRRMVTWMFELGSGKWADVKPAWGAEMEVARADGEEALTIDDHCIDLKKMTQTNTKTGKVQ